MKTPSRSRVLLVSLLSVSATALLESNVVLCHSFLTTRLLGFINADRIPRHHFVDKAMLLMPTLDHAGSQRLFTTLILTLRREKKVGLVRFVKREHSDPFLAALIPLPESAQVSIV